jgi:hypothetical protein
VEKLGNTSPTEWPLGAADLIRYFIVLANGFREMPDWHSFIGQSITAAINNIVAGNAPGSDAESERLTALVRGGPMEAFLKSILDAGHELGASTKGDAYPRFFSLLALHTFLRHVSTTLRQVAASAAAGDRAVPIDLPTAAPYVLHKGRLVRLGDDFLARAYELFARSLTACDASHIKICEDCASLFWAKQRRSKGCSDPCNNRIKQRSWFRREQLKSEVREMTANGLSAKDIAHTLGESTEFIERLGVVPVLKQRRKIHGTQARTK